jgi:5-methylcytosine-specific restriction endonuclease McrA
VTRFPRRRDPAFMQFMARQIEAGRPCDNGCGRMAVHRAHLKPRSRGGDDKGNVALCCKSCHDHYEKRPAPPVLLAAAHEWTVKYDAERAAGVPQW